MTSLAGKFASGIARLTNLGKRDDDPLSSLKAASRWLDNLPVGDAFKCQQTILEELRRFNENSTEAAKDRLGVLMLLDEKSRDLQDTLVRQYLRNPRMSRPVESQLWHAVYGLYWEIARGYHAFVLNFARGSGKIPHENQIPLVTLRAIRFFGQLLKWRAVRYLGPGEKLWLRLHNLYRIAENEGFLRTPHTACAGETPCTCELAYLHILMLHLANSGTLYPRQIDLVDRWLCQWRNHLSLDTRADTKRHTFAVDLSADHGPRRIRKPESDKPMRFWGTAALLDKLNAIAGELREGAPAAALGLTEDARTSESIDLLNHLQQHWSPLSSREQRRAPRVSVKRLIDVAQGFNAIVGQIKSTTTAAPAASPYASDIDYSEADDIRVYGFVTERTRERNSQLGTPAVRLSSNVERWVMQDESACGYGAVIESRDKDWLRVGALLALKAPDAADWKLGVVRRLSRLGDNSSSVGIEIMPMEPRLVMLYDVIASSGYKVDGWDNNSATQAKAGLWLEDASQSSLIIDPVNYAPGKIVHTKIMGERRQLTLGNPTERSEGWIRVSIEPVKD
ncbi:MAG: hypothetical protein LDL16_09140 [Thiobacillus sp.]|nr:hypothetical protein [Thiobacillus sp.]